MTETLFDTEAGRWLQQKGLSCSKTYRSCLVKTFVMLDTIFTFSSKGFDKPYSSLKKR